MSSYTSRARLERALRQYVRLGLADGRMDEYKKIRIMKGYAQSESEFLDLVAVSDLIKTVAFTNRREELRAFIEVYMRGGARLGDISLAALRFAHKNHLDVRTVYRRVAALETLYGKIREYYDK